MNITVPDLVQTMRGCGAAVQLEYNAAQTSILLGVSPRTLARMRTEGSGPPFVTRNGYHFYRLCDLAEWSLAQPSRRKIGMNH